MEVVITDDVVRGWNPLIAPNSNNPLLPDISAMKETKALHFVTPIHTAFVWHNTNKISAT